MKRLLFAACLSWAAIGCDMPGGMKAGVSRYYKVEVWSGGNVVRTYTALETRDQAGPYAYAGTIRFLDNATGRDVQVAGTVTVEFLGEYALDEKTNSVVKAR